MKVRVTIESQSDTDTQDRYLRRALEKLAEGLGDNSDRKLVMDTFKARMTIANLIVERLPRTSY